MNNIETGVYNAHTEIATNVSDIDTLESYVAGSKEFYLDKEYCYGANTKLIDLCDNANYTSVAGTQSADGTHYKVNNTNATGAVKILENDNTAGVCYSKRAITSIDLTKANDGSAIGTDGYVYITAYISDVTAIDTTAGNGLFLALGTGNAWGGGDPYFYKSVVTDLVTGWNYLKIAKSAWITNGAADWSTIGGIWLGWYSNVNMQNEYVTYNFLQLIRKDPSSSAPNQFQRDGARLLQLSAGEYYLGYENDILICRNMSPGSALSLLGQTAYSDCIASHTFKCKSASDSQAFGLYVDASNYVLAWISSDTLYLRKRVGGSNTDVSATLAVAIGDKITINIIRDSNSFYCYAIKNFESDPDYLASLYASAAIGTSAYLCTFDTTYYSDIENLSITTISHAHHADIAEVAKEVTTHYNEGAFAESTTITHGTTYSKSVPLGRPDYKFALVVFAVDAAYTDSPGCTVHTGRTAASAISNYGYADGAYWSYTSDDRSIDSSLTNSAEINGAAGGGKLRLNDCYIDGSNLYFEWENTDGAGDYSLDITVQWRVFR